MNQHAKMTKFNLDVNSTYNISVDMSSETFILHKHNNKSLKNYPL